MSGSVREGKIVRVISTTGSGFMSRAEPTFILPTPQRLRTSSAPSMATCPTRSSCKARPSTPSSEGMSAAMRYIRLAWVLLGRVRSRGKTSERSWRNAPRESTPQRSTKAIRSPLISMWSSCGMSLPTFHTMPRPSGAICQRCPHTATADSMKMQVSKVLPVIVRCFVIKSPKDSNYSSIPTARTSPQPRLSRNRSVCSRCPAKRAFCNS